ncbi:MAG TPA: R3H domain-containing nucleic acid-binding protein [Luteitalea sp.]|nr:R3H domain-containing nucleic acid-binding protein [Luteitalea sp.]
MSTQATLHEQVGTFVRDVVVAMGLDVTVTSGSDSDGVRVDISGEEGELLVRRKGEALDALQHLVNSIYRDQSGRDGRIVVDCLNFRKGKDAELRQLARFLIEKAKTTGAPQEMGPLNSYSRRLVHMEVSLDAGVTSESQGDGLVKTIIIAPR